MVKVILCELPSLCDRIHARAVCKNWLLPLNEIPPRSSSSELPLLMSFKWDNTIDIQGNLSQCKLVDLLYKKQNSRVQKISNSDFFFASKTELTKEEFYHLSRQRRVCNAPCEPKFDQKTSFFLYIQSFHQTHHHSALFDYSFYSEFYPSFDIATFSLSPDEDDFVFFVVRRDPFQNGQISIATYRRSIMEQQQKWKIDQFKEEKMIGFDQIKGSVYVDGIFYCVSYYGTLMSFNVALHEWNILTALRPIPNDKFDSAYLVELNGELLVVYRCLRVKRLYVFDKSSKVWVRRENRYLKDSALFLETYGSFAFSVDGADVDQNEIANNTFYCEEGHKTFYFSFVNKSDNWEENLHELYDAQLRNSESTKIWIQPSSKF